MCIDNEIFRTIPGTEANLTLEVNPHPFDETPQQPSPAYPVLVDGIRGEAEIGSLGGYSTRIGIRLCDEHADLGTEFMTKYFDFIEPGLVHWGHHNKTFRIEKIIGFNR